MKKFRLLASLLVAIPCVAMAQGSPSSASESDIAARVKHVLSTTPVIDGHNDLPWEIRVNFGNVGRINLEKSTADLTVKTDDGSTKTVHLMTDVPRMHEGHMGAQFWSVWIPATITGPKAVEMALQQIDLVHNMCAKYSQDFAMAYTAADIKRIENNGKIACLIGIEGGEMIDNSMAVLRDFYRLGARYMTLTHSLTTDWADSATDKPEHHGLTQFGRDVVLEMNRLGMMVDISHVSPDTMRDVLDTTKAPVIFSHSSARALVDYPRDVPDDVLRRVKKNGGVVMVNFYPVFVSQADNVWWAKHAGISKRYHTQYVGQPERIKAAIAKWEQAHPRPKVTIDQVADHVEHIAKVAGYQSVGIGSDFDGIGITPEGLDGVDKYPALFRELARRGWTNEQLAGLAGRNVLRVMSKVEQVAKKLQATEHPSHVTLEVDDDNA
ncbi:MAG TPA: dipeptidase [Oleiagrimonas sp.]|nr:dipeptidase [Oleiagrimonas sp.]